MIETNVRRVLSRVFFDGRAVSDKTLRALGALLIPKRRGCEWNWAVMDIGAAYCKAKGHRTECPLNVLHGPMVVDFHKRPQTHFAGSRRFYRGRILVALGEHRTGCAKKALCAAIGLNVEQCADILDDLAREGLIRDRGARCILP